MTYNEILANKIRQALSAIPFVEEQKKMGGVSFMIKKKMFVRAHSDGTMMLRCRPDMTEELLKKKGVTRFFMKNKTNMKGWLLISPTVIEEKQDFDYWIRICLDSVGVNLAIS